MSHKQTEASFWERVDRSTSGCWEWRGCTSSTGYGSVSWHGKLYTAHRLAAWLVGLVNDPATPTKDSATFVLHKCDNRRCCNPKHFFLGPYSDNQLDAYRKKRKVQPRGHKHTNAKLSARQAAAIRREYASGRTRQTDLADKYGISQRAVSLVVRRKTYI